MRLSIANNSLLERVKHQVAVDGADMIDRCLKATTVEMEIVQRQSRSAARRSELSQAHAALLRAGPVLVAEYPRALMARVEESLIQDPEEAVERVASSEESILALLDDDEVTQFVESSRLRQIVGPIVSEPLGELDSLVSSVLGFPMVRSEQNPFRPEIMCQTLIEALESLPQPAQIRRHWLRHVAEPFAVQLRRLYRDLVSILQEQGVEQARYRLRLSTAAGSAYAYGGENAGIDLQGDSGDSELNAAVSVLKGMAGQLDVEGANLNLSQFAGDEHFTVADEKLDVVSLAPLLKQLARLKLVISASLLQRFLYQPNWIEENDEALTPDYYQEVDREMADLQMSAPGAVAFDPQAREAELARLREQDPVRRGARRVDIDGSLPSDDWGKWAPSVARQNELLGLKKQATSISQVLGVEAVRALIEQAVDDERVLAPVREAFVALEPVLWHRAMTEPRFFNDADDPARRLVESVAQRSFRYNDEFSPEFEAFMKPVEVGVRELVACDPATGEDFDALCNRFETIWRDQDEQERAAREKAINSVSFAQERQTVADRIAWELSMRSDLNGVPAKVADFLYKDWSLVLAHAQLTGKRTELDPGGYLVIVSDLLWSVNHDLIMEQPIRLFEVVPHVVRTLRRGLEMLDKDPIETQAFFDALIRYHEPVLQLRRLRRAQDIESSGFADLDDHLLDALQALKNEPKFDENMQPQKAIEPWLARQEREVVGLLDDEPSDDDTGWARVDDAEVQDANQASPSLLQGSVGAHLSETQAANEAMLDPQMQARIQAELSRLRVGDWVDLWTDGRWRRAQMSWASDNGALWMFISEGGQAHGMSRRTSEKYMMKGRFIPVDVDPVIERALRGLAEQAAAEDAAEESAPAEKVG